MQYAFAWCPALTTLNLSAWVTSKVTDMSCMFWECTALTTLNVSTWNVSAVTNLEDTFAYCSALTALDISSWDVANVTTLCGTFDHCNALKSLDISQWKVDNVETLYATFYYCTALTTLDLSTWNVQKVTSLEGTFSYCTALVTLNLSQWEVTSVTNMRQTFTMSDKLTTIYAGNWTNAPVTNSNSMFFGCTSINGGNGTTYTTYAISNLGYAHIDGGTSDPGYFSAVPNATLEDYTWSALSYISNSISENGTSSPYYNDMVALMKAGSTKTVTLPAVTDTTGSNKSIAEGTTVKVMIIGFKHDALTPMQVSAAGMTFQVVNDSSNGLPTHYMNSTNTNSVGWQESSMRKWLANVVSEAFSEAIPQITTVYKWAHEESGTTYQGSSDTANVTSDDHADGGSMYGTNGSRVTLHKYTLFIPCLQEYYGKTSGLMKYYYPLEGNQYEYYSYLGITSTNYSGLKTLNTKTSWLRSVVAGSTTSYHYLGTTGNYGSSSATSVYSVAPCFCL
jgi:surface protein